MTELLNYKFSFFRKDKYVFVPNEESIEKGNSLLRFVEKEVSFPNSFYHFAKGGHVGAIHRHIDNRYFFRIDLQRYFYSIGRNRIARALHSAGFRKARTYAKWSSVKSPYTGGPAYALPIGFIQSPALASMVFMQSPLMRVTERLISEGICVSVYLDDLIGSGRDKEILEKGYRCILAACEEAEFTINTGKLAAPDEHIQAFNCDIAMHRASVTVERIEKFAATHGSPAGEAAFDAYCRKVAEQNRR